MIQLKVSEMALLFPALRGGGENCYRKVKEMVEMKIFPLGGEGWAVLSAPHAPSYTVSWDAAHLGGCHYTPEMKSEMCKDPERTWGIGKILASLLVEIKHSNMWDWAGATMHHTGGRNQGPGGIPTWKGACPTWPTANVYSLQGKVPPDLLQTLVSTSSRVLLEQHGPAGKEDFSSYRVRKTSLSWKKKFQVEDRFRPLLLKRDEWSSEDRASSDLEARGNPRGREGSWGDAKAIWPQIAFTRRFG